MATTTNFGWETPDDTDLVKDGAAAMRTLGNSIDTSFVDLKGGTTGQILSKASNTDLDYAWITNDVGDITAVTAGTGISGGGTTGAVTITNSMATAIDAKGDLVVGTGADTFDRLAVGSNNQVLTADSTTSTGLKWAAAGASFVGASVYKSANQSLTNATLTAISFNTEYFDTDAMHDNVTNNSRITVASGKGGKYLLVGNLVYAANATGFRQFFIRINGANTWYSASNPAIPAYASFPNYVSYTFVLDLAAGDYVELFGLQNSGGALDVQGGDTGVSYFQLIKVG